MAGSLDINPAGPSLSPTSSGRASPVSRKWALLGADEPPSKDKVFRRYASSVERALALFDSALLDWADYPAFLGRLMKSLQGHPPGTTAVPSKAIIAKRLAQCLNPSLPSGVHQKALEVYAFIFGIIGKDALSKDLPLYLPGLSSTLAFASLSVRSPFLELLETFILRVDARSLRPALRAIILALLPGLEEETSEDFDKTLKLLDEFKIAIRPTSSEDLGQGHSSGDEYFWQCFFLAAITSHGRRSGALAYLVRILPKLGTTLSHASPAREVETYSIRLAEMVTSPEPGLLLRCFAAGLIDEQLLIQRGFLDLLVTHLPLHSVVLQARVKPEDLVLLMTAAIGVTIRREMSLNRRLWTWLLGPEQIGSDPDPESPTNLVGDFPAHDSSSQTGYFHEFAIRPLVDSLLKIMARNVLTPGERARPSRIILSLMDKAEIGGSIVPDVFMPMINDIRRYKDMAVNKADFLEVLRSASMFFDGVESRLIYRELIGLIALAIRGGRLSADDRIDKLALVNFILVHFNIREEEMLTVHIPLTILMILTMLKDAKEKKLDAVISDGGVTNLSLNIAMDLVELIPERPLQFSSGPGQSQFGVSERELPTKRLSPSEIIQNVNTFYVQDNEILRPDSPPFTPAEVRALLLSEAGSLVCQSLSDSISSAEIGVKSKLLVLILSKSPGAIGLNVGELLSAMQKKLEQPSQLPFVTFTSIISLTTTLYSNKHVSPVDVSSLVIPLVRLAWLYLGASYPKYHVEAVRYLWQLQMTLSFTNREIESAICALMVEHDTHGTFAIRDADPGRSFGILWTHTLQENSGHVDRRSSKIPNTESKSHNRSLVVGNYEVMLARPLFLILDALLDESTQLYLTVRAWLQTLPGTDKLFHLFVAKFLDFEFLQRTDDTYIYVDDDDLDQCLYYIRTLSSVLTCSNSGIWAALAENSISTDKSYLSLYQITGQDCEVSLLEFFLHVCLKVISGNYDTKNSDLFPRISQLHRTALRTLNQIIRSPYASILVDLQIEHVLIDRLSQSLDGPDPFIQVLLLDGVFAALQIRGLRDEGLSLKSPTSELKRSIPPDGLRVLQTPRPSSIAGSEDHYKDTHYSPPPKTLVKCLQAGLSASSSRPVLDHWVNFLTECLPLYSDIIFQIIITLVETFCSEIDRTFTNLQRTFRKSETIHEGLSAPETTLITLLNGLEQVLSFGHDRMLQDESQAPVAKIAEQPQGFFGNMVSGVFTSETRQVRSATANPRLPVLLAMRDAVRICFTIWSWGGFGSATQDIESIASFNYTSLRMRNRARRLLERLFAEETLECLETVVEVWQNDSQDQSDTGPPIVFNLLHVLDGSRPKHTIPAIFHAIYSRKNASFIDPNRISSQTAQIKDYDLVIFLVEYAKSLEDDAMDEIWEDCMLFLKDLLGNPMPHRQTLPSLLEFAAILGEKVDNTNFGEQRKMRRELGVGINTY